MAVPPILLSTLASQMQAGMRYTIDDVNDTLTLSTSNVNLLRSSNASTGSGIDTWLATFNPSGGSATAMSMTTDRQGNVIVSGQYSTSGIILRDNNNSVAAQLRGTISFGGFLLKYNSSGVFQWGSTLDGGGWEQGDSVTTDPSGNIYMYCFYNSSGCTVYNTSGATIGTLTNLAQNNAVAVIKFSPTGQHLWNIALNSEDTDRANCITSDALGNIYISILQEGNNTTRNLQIYNTSGVLDRTITTSWPCTHVVKFNSAGGYVWNTYSPYTEFRWISADNNGNVYIAGTQNQGSSAVYGPGQTFSMRSVTNGWTGGMLLKLNTFGNGEWVWSWQRNQGGQNMWSVAADPSGNAVALGTYNGMPDLYFNETLHGPLFSASGTMHAMILRVNSTGQHSFTRVFPTATSMNRVACDLNSVYVGGGASDVVTVVNQSGVTFGTVPLYDGVYSGPVIRFDTTGGVIWNARAGQNINAMAVSTSGKLYVTGYNTPSDNKIWNTSGTVLKTLPAYNGSYVTEILGTNTPAFTNPPYILPVAASRGVIKHIVHRQNANAANAIVHAFNSSGTFTVYTVPQGSSLMLISTNNDWVRLL